jgi:hypothetical protein
MSHIFSFWLWEIIWNLASIHELPLALRQHKRDKGDEVRDNEQTTHHARKLPIPDQSQEEQVNCDHDW